MAQSYNAQPATTETGAPVQDDEKDDGLDIIVKVGIGVGTGHAADLIILRLLGQQPVLLKQRTGYRAFHLYHAFIAKRMAIHLPHRKAGNKPYWNIVDSLQN